MTSKSFEIFEKSKQVIVGGVNSPVRAFSSLDVHPLVIERGSGDTIWDVDRESYIDYCMSWGALLHGHAPPFVLEKAVKRLQNGSSFGTATPVEEEFARLIINLFPGIDKLRFVSSGTEATMTAIRLSRGYTNRPLIVKFDGNYHGHSDALLARAGSGVTDFNDSSCFIRGIPIEALRQTISLPYNDFEMAKRFFHHFPESAKIAAVIVEPIAANMGVVPGKREFLELLRRETERLGAVLIFDEVISGFRVNIKGAQGLYGIQSDLTCFGKIIGGGFPAAALGGCSKIMDCLAPIGEVYQAGTLSGNPVAMQAGLETLKRAMQERFYDDLEEKTHLITKPIQMALENSHLNACVQETVGMFTIFFGRKRVEGFEDIKKLDKKCFNTFFKYLLDHGVYFSPSPYEASFLSAAHTEEHLKKTRDLIIEFIENV